MHFTVVALGFSKVAKFATRETTFYHRFLICSCKNLNFTVVALGFSKVAKLATQTNNLFSQGFDMFVQTHPFYRGCSGLLSEKTQFTTCLITFLCTMVSIFSKYAISGFKDFEALNQKLHPIFPEFPHFTSILFICRKHATP